MTTIITRLYAEADQAKAAVAALLKTKIYNKADMDVIGGTDTGALMATILKSGVYKNAATIYAERVSAGNTLVVVRAPFGNGVRAMRMLDEFEPIDAGVRHTEVHVEAKSSKSYSENKYLPSLFDGDVMMLTGGIFPALTKSSTPFSSMFGLPLLSGSGKRSTGLMEASRATPFSSMLGLPVLSSKSSSTALVKNATPLSSAMGMPTLTKK